MQRLLVISAGFAGMYAAISAARLRHLQGVSPDDLEIALISPEPFLVIRPRLYEPKPETMKAPQAASKPPATAPVEISKAAPGVDQAMLIGMRLRKARMTAQSPIAVPTAIRPDVAWPGVAPTDFKPCKTTVNELA